MALLLPTPDQLEAYKQGINDQEALQLAADLFTVATGVTENPTDPMEARLVNYAVMEMAWYLQVNHEDLEAEFSPFSSERIGSYSYSKMTTAVQKGIATGVPAFDYAVAYFGAQGQPDGTVCGTTTEWVFEQTGVPVIPPTPNAWYRDPVYKVPLSGE